MPSRAPRVCGHCGGVHQSGERCPKTMVADRERKARHDAKRPSRQARGYDSEWVKARTDFLLAYPSCAKCGGKASLVDHVIPIRQAPHRRLDRSNFQSLCTSCHSGWKQAHDHRSHT